MASRYELEVTISSAKNLKNVNWRTGDLKPYAVVWVDPNAKCSTRVDDNGEENPKWDQTLIIPFSVPIEDATLHIDVVHAGSVERKPLVGSAKLPLRDVVDDVGIGGRSFQSLVLKRPSGRPQGNLEVKVAVRQPAYRQPDPYRSAPYGYGVPPPQPYDGIPPPQPYVGAYGVTQPDMYRSAPPPVGYPYGAPPPPVSAAYGQGSYGQQQEQKKSGKFGMGTGLAVGAAAGLLGGLAIAEGVDYVEDKIADDAADRVEDDFGYDDGGDGF